MAKLASEIQLQAKEAADAVATEIDVIMAGPRPPILYRQNTMYSPQSKYEKDVSENNCKEDEDFCQMVENGARSLRYLAIHHYYLLAQNRKIETADKESALRKDIATNSVIDSNALKMKVNAPFTSS